MRDKSQDPLMTHGLCAEITLQAVGEIQAQSVGAIRPFGGGNGAAAWGDPPDGVGDLHEAVGVAAGEMDGQAGGNSGIASSRRKPVRDDPHGGDRGELPDANDVGLVVEGLAAISEEHLHRRRL